MFSQPQKPEFFPRGQERRLEDLPKGQFRDNLERLPAPQRARALEWLGEFGFPDADVESLQVDAHGGICYGCTFGHHRAEEVGPENAPAADPGEPVVANAPVPVSPFPSSLIFSSRPGATNVIYVNFAGETVTGTAWNTSLNRTSIPAVAFSTDSDLSTFSDAEQLAIKRVWQRMAEDFAPFNVNVTTQRPTSFTTRTAMVVVTRNTDANGDLNPSDTAGGVAYVNVFARSDFANFRPAWVYHNNLANVESYIAEAASHEVGHNLGLSHDGTSTAAYYGGHGSSSDPISWGPLMGTGYDRSVSQWSKGEYYQANNLEDDLSIITGKLGYRADDHGGTVASATALTLTSGTQIVSTTPENDPTNANPVNKGVIELNTDVDIFTFVTGSGTVRMKVDPWIQPAGTRGGNLHLRIDLYNETGGLVASHAPTTTTNALIETSLTQGKYYLHVRNAAAGNPLVSPPTGYTSYGSIGQYFISGFVQDASGVVQPPLAELVSVPPLNESGLTSKQFTVSYTDNVGIDVATIGTGDVRVTGPNGYNQLAQFVSVSSTTNGTPRSATYSVTPPGGGAWTTLHNGTYTITMEAAQVRDVENAYVSASTLGQFSIDVPIVYYAANMDVSPGWTLEPQWQYGTPGYPSNSNGPTSSYSGTNKIIAYNLTGNYANNLATKSATTPNINTSGANSITLRFRRWLRLKRNDTASIQASANGTTWTTLWSSMSPVNDTSWQLVQYSIPAPLVGSSTLRLRWTMASNNSQNEIGWNIDDVELLGSGSLDSTPPSVALNVSNLSAGGSPSHVCALVCTDATAVRLASFDSGDITVIGGPNAQSAPVEFSGANSDSDGSPITATYSVSPPGGGLWNDSHNGTYTVTLMGEAVEDIRNNKTSEVILGTFNVAIVPPPPGQLTVESSASLTASGPVGGAFSPGSITYTLGNNGGTSLNWIAGKSSTWVDLSATGGTIAPGATAQVSVSLNGNAAALGAGVYEDDVLFTNVTGGAGSTSRNVSLNIEVEAGLDVEVSLPGRNEAGEFQVAIQGVPGTSVVVKACGNLMDWQTIATGVIGQDGVLVVADPASVNEPNRFYKIGKVGP
ncbi:MAG: zinc-dependent metalloprotease family protein [Verrucomicrobiales bacterium]